MLSTKLKTGTMIYLFNGEQVNIDRFDIASLDIKGKKLKYLHPRKVTVLMNAQTVSFRIEGKEYCEVTLPAIDFGLMKLWDKLQEYDYEFIGDSCLLISVTPDSRIIEDEFNNLLTYDYLLDLQEA